MEWPFVRRFKLDAVLTVNQVYLDEINRLNQELASELNNHRETKKKAKSLVKYWQERCLRTEKELEETKDALKIAQEENERINAWIFKNREDVYQFVEAINKAINNFTE